MRIFNTAGPVNPEKHYCLPPLHRLDLTNLLNLIDLESYFVLHAPRQTGKTSCLLSLRDRLNEAGRFRCLYFNVESGQTARGDVRATVRCVLDEMSSWAATTFEDNTLAEMRTQVLSEFEPHTAFGVTVSRWAKSLDKPLVLLIDEIDTLSGDGLISVLRQLRSGYPKRPRHFPQSVILCGVRDVRDYRIRTSSDEIVIGGSAFNIKTESLRLGDFSRREVKALYQQHVQETSQAFTPGALDTVWELTRGQPWLVNALGREACFRMEDGLDRKRPVTAETILQAKENLILRRDTHLDQLADKLREERVRRVLEPLLAGEDAPESFPDDDLTYLHDLGLIRLELPIEIANPIYREIIPRQLVFSEERTIARHAPEWYVDAASGRLRTIALLQAFTDYFRQNSEHWIERFDYKEAGPQLLLQAFLHRIVNSGGRIEREYGLGRRRTDLLVIWPCPGGEQRVVIELKILRQARQSTIAEGLEQTADYMDRSNAEEGHLVVFDRDEGRSWEERIFREVREHQGKKIHIWGM